MAKGLPLTYWICQSMRKRLGIASSLPPSSPQAKFRHLRPSSNQDCETDAGQRQTNARGQSCWPLSVNQSTTLFAVEELSLTHREACAVFRRCPHAASFVAANFFALL